MKRFRSSVQALLTLRQRAEQTALERYAKTLLARQAALEKLDAVSLEQNACWTRRRQELAQGCSAGTLAQEGAADIRLREQREAAERALAAAEVSVNQSLQQMLSMRRERETVEKHVQRQRSLHQLESGREEQKALDDLAQRRGLPVLSMSRVQPANP